MTRVAKLWCQLCLLILLGLLSLLSLLYWLWLPLRLRILQSNTTSLKHDSPSWTTMTMLNLLYSCSLCW